MFVDVHTHCDSVDPQEVRVFVRACEAAGARACFFSVGPRSDHPYCTNEQVLTVTEQYRDVLIPFALVDLWDSADAGCVEALAERGFRGLKCTSPYWPYDHDQYMPVYEKAEQLGLPIVFHTGSYRPNAQARQTRRPLLRNMHPIAIDRIARAFPDLRIVMAHMGTRMFRREAAELIMLHPHVYADLAGTGSWKSLSASELTDLLVHPLAKPEARLDALTKLVLGSDAYVTFPHLVAEAQEGYRSLLQNVGVEGRALEAILGGTVGSWLSA